MASARKAIPQEFGGLEARRRFQVGWRVSEVQAAFVTTLLGCPTDSSHSLLADGKWVIAFLYPKPGGPTSPEQLVRIPFTGGLPELIFSASPESEISCANPSTNLCAIAEATEDRKQVVVTAFDPVKGRGLELAKFDLDPNQTSIQRGVLVPGIGAWDCCEISPDGTRLAVRQGAEGPIHILSLRGQPAEVIQAKGLNMRGDYYWAADGKGLYVSNGVKGGMALLHVDLQGHTHVLLENYGSDVAYGIPSPDGRHLAILGLTVNSNTWMIENF
jgi:hypothetical protein